MQERMKHFIFPLLFIGASTINLNAQGRTYYLFESKAGKFSFKCPSSWLYEEDSLGDTFDPLSAGKWNDGRFVSYNKQEAKEYADCFDGIIFYITLTYQSLDSALLANGLYVKENSKYYGTFSYMSDKLVETEDIRGPNWVGIHHFNSCRIWCKGDDVKPIVEGCEFMYFSNSAGTVEIATAGMAIPADVLQTILSTFRFKE